MHQKQTREELNRPTRTPAETRPIPTQRHKPKTKNNQNANRKTHMQKVHRPQLQMQQSTQDPKLPTQQMQRPK